MDTFWTPSHTPPAATRLLNLKTRSLNCLHFWDDVTKAMQVYRRHPQENAFKIGCYSIEII